MSEELINLLMEDAGCKGFDTECLKNILTLVKENKYPQFDPAEKMVIDEKLSELIRGAHIISEELSSLAREAGLAKTADALKGIEEKPEKTVKKEKVKSEGKRKAEGEEVKGGKGALIISILALVISLLTLYSFLNTQFGLTIYNFAKSHNLPVGTSIFDQINELNKKMDQLTLEIRKLSMIVSSYERSTKKTLLALNNKIDALDNKINNVNSRIDKIEEKVTRIEEKYRGLSLEINATKKEYVALKNDIGSILKEINNLNAEISKLKTSLEREIKAGLERVAENITTLNAKILKIYKHLNETQERLKDLSSKLAALKDEINSNAANISHLGKALRKLQTQLTSLSDEINKVKTAIGSLKVEISNNTKAISLLNSKLVALESGLESLNETVRVLESKLITLKSELLNRTMEIIREEINSLPNNARLINALSNRIVAEVSQNITDRVINLLLSKGSPLESYVKRIVNETLNQAGILPSGGIVPTG